MNNSQFILLANMLPDIAQDRHFDKIAFRFKKKIVATLHENAQQACLKLPSGDQAIFHAANPDLIYPVPNKWGLQGWTFMRLADTPDLLVVSMLTAAYCQVAGKNSQNFAPLLWGKTTLLRPLRATDLETLHDLRTNPLVNAHLERPGAASLDETGAFIKKIREEVAAERSHYWAISKQLEADLLGTICLWNLNQDQKEAEIGFELHPKYQGQGIMAEAIGAVLDLAFGQLGLERILAYAMLSNEKSLKALTRQGFRHLKTEDQYAVLIKENR